MPKADRDVARRRSGKSDNAIVFGDKLRVLPIDKLYPFYYGQNVKPMPLAKFESITARNEWSLQSFRKCTWIVATRVWNATINEYEQMRVVPVMLENVVVGMRLSAENERALITCSAEFQGNRDDGSCILSDNVYFNEPAAIAGSDIFPDFSS